jgi:hypothetical protein
MDTLLTIAPAGFLAVEETLSLATALTGMLALFLILSAAAVPAGSRPPLFLGGVSLLAATWFQGVQLSSWREAFELAGTSYCVTGHSPDASAPVMAWALGVPGLLLALGMARIPWGKRGDYLLEKNAAALIAMGFFSLFHAAGFLLILASGYFSCVKMPRYAAPGAGAQGYMAFGAVIAGMIIKSLGVHHLLPLGNGAEAVLVNGTIVRTAGDLLCFLIPGIVLAVRVYTRVSAEIKNPPGEAQFVD